MYLIDDAIMNIEGEKRFRVKVAMNNVLFLENYVSEDGDTYDFVKFYNEIVALKNWESENFLAAWCASDCEFQPPASALKTYLARIGITVE